MLALVLLGVAASASASHLGLLASDSAALKPTSLAQAYAKEIPQVGTQLPKDVLRDHIRKDLMPRLMATQDDRTAYELSLNIFEKLGGRSSALVELNNRIQNGQKIYKPEATEMSEANMDITRDMELLQEKIKETTSSDPVSHQTLKLVANSVQGYACAFKATQIDILSQGKKEKKSCVMPFPGSFIMLDQQIAVPKKMDIILPSSNDVSYLQPQQWMAQHLRRTIWCKDSFKTHGFEADPTCDAVSGALDMPHHDELADERAALVEIEVDKAKGLKAPDAFVPLTEETPEKVSLIQQQEKKTEEKTDMNFADQLKTQIEENARRSQEMHEEEEQVTKKLSLQQKRQKLRQLREKLAEDKSRLAAML